jgi:hypothetical protein
MSKPDGKDAMAGWQSGYAAACKAVYAGSIPASASIKRDTATSTCGDVKHGDGFRCPGGGIGRHKGLKIPRLYGRAGSSPAPGTIS